MIVQICRGGAVDAEALVAGVLAGNYAAEGLEVLAELSLAEYSKGAWFL